MSPGQRPRVVIAINSAWNIANFRGGLVHALQQAGWDVIALAPRDEHVPRVEALGARFVEITMAPGGTNPWEDWRLYRNYQRLLRELRPQAFLGFTIKPNIWGSRAAQSLGIPVINNIAGLGSAFVTRSWVTGVARFLYRHSLKRSRHVLFQNEDDRNYFIHSGLVEANRSSRIPGSGVDLQRFTATPLPDEAGPLRLLMVARLLRDKGLQEFAEAGRLLRERGVAAELQLLGPADPHNPSATPIELVRDWERQGRLRYLGTSDEVRPWLQQAHAIVLPSYREGVPRTLLEGAACGRPLIATDVVGCRDAVRHGRNGLLLPVRDAAALADTLQHFVELPREQRVDWGRASRALAESEFDERLVTDRYLTLLAELRGGAR